jgi:hypothetical protein
MRLLRTSAALIAVGLALGCVSSTGSATPPTPSSAAAKKDPDLITASEIATQSFRDGYDIVQRLRPAWFTKKSGASTTRRMGQSPSASATGAGLLVYLGSARIGGVEALRTLSAPTIESMKFLDAATATATLPGIGSSVVSGAIVVKIQRGT